MLPFAIAQLCITPIYCWFYIWTLGYHGVFTLILCNLLLLTYLTTWDLYISWTQDFNFMFDFATWIELGNSNFIDYILSADLLSLVVLVIMTSGTFIVLSFVYIEMWDDKEGSNFAILLIAFLAFMSILVSSGNLLMFYLGWEGIGLTSLFLISFWSERSRAIKATLKVYTINKFGDFLILISISLILMHLGNTEFIFLNTFALILNHYGLMLSYINPNIIEITSILFVIGGGVKSAQFGPHIWLLEAMEAPLGASALMHSSTLVIAGVALVCKLAEFIDYANWAKYILIIWGSWTALFAAFIACWQFELKIIMAYSTISSMGFLYYLLGLNAHIEMFIYLIIHAYIKIFLFLTVGGIMLHCNGCQDIRWMGGLLHYIPSFYIFYVAGSLSLAGIPYWGGYYCKSTTWSVTTQLAYFGPYLQILMLLTSLFTYIYLLRTGILVFMGIKNGHHSAYRLRPTSLISLITMTILMFFACYSSIMWVKIVESFYTNVQITLTHFYSLTHSIYNYPSYLNWWSLTLLYTILISTIFYIWLIINGQIYNSLKTWYNNFIILYVYAYIICIWLYVKF